MNRLIRSLIAPFVVALLTACGSGPTTQDEPQLPGEFQLEAVQAFCLDETREGSLAGTKLAWTASEGAAGYRVLRDSELIAELTAATTEHDDVEGLEAGAVVSYVVRAYTAAGVLDAAAEPYTVPGDLCPDSEEGDPENPDDPEDPENPVEPEDPEKPEEPEPDIELHVTGTCNPLPHSELTWTAVPAALGYTLFKNGLELVAIHPSETSFTDAELEIERDNEYVLEVDLDGSTVQSAAISVNVPFTDCELRANHVASLLYSNLMIDRNGGVWAWGTVEKPQGSSEHISQQRVTGLQDIVAVYGYGEHAVVLDAFGQVRFKPGEDAWVYPSDEWEMMAATEFTDSVADLPPLRDIAIGATHVLALSVDGRVYSWGTNYHGETGQLPDPHVYQEPLQIPGLESVVGVFAGDSRSMAVTSDGKLLAWGSNHDGMLGLETYDEEVHQPGLVGGIDGVVSEVHMDYEVTLILTVSGDVYGWGRSRRLGIGSSSGATEVPHLLSGLGKVKALAVGPQHALAVQADGTVVGWGSNSNRQLGPDTAYKYEPVTVYDDVPAVQVTAGWGHSMILDSSGQLHGIGSNREFQLGHASDMRHYYFVDNNFSFPTAITELAAGPSFVLAALDDGSLWSWGRDTSGALGAGGQRETNEPAQVMFPVPVEVASVSVGINHVLVLDRAGRVWSWGSDVRGQLGTDSGFRNEPGLIDSLSDVQAIAAGENFSLALDDDGTVFAWGYNFNGQLGVGDRDSREIPTEIDFDQEVVAIAAGSRHAALITEDAEVYSWGSRSDGAIGNGGSTSGRETTPVQSSVASVVDIVAGDGHTVALYEDGTVYAWGSNRYGIGTGGTPAPVNGLSGIVAVDSSQRSVLARNEAGTVFGWGQADTGQLGFETEAEWLPAPMPLPLVAAGDIIESGRSYSLVVADDGRLMVAGDDEDGQLGLGNRRYFSAIPVLVLGLPGVGPLDPGVQ